MVDEESRDPLVEVVYRCGSCKQQRSSAWDAADCCIDVRGEAV